MSFSNGKYRSIVYSPSEIKNEIPNGFPSDNSGDLAVDSKMEGRNLEPLIQGISNECEVHFTDVCGWPHCNPTCPPLVDPFTGECLHALSVRYNLVFISQGLYKKCN